NQTAEIRGLAYLLAGNAVTTVEHAAIGRRLSRHLVADSRSAPVKRPVVVNHEFVHGCVGVAHTIGEYDDSACFAQFVEILANGVEPIARGVKSSGLEHEVDSDETRADAGEQVAVVRVARKFVGPVAGKAFGESDPGIAHAIDFKGGKIGIFGAKVADGDAVMRAYGFDCGVEFAEVRRRRIGETAGDGAEQACETGNPDRHDIHPKLTHTGSGL